MAWIEITRIYYEVQFTLFFVCVRLSCSPLSVVWLPKRISRYFSRNSHPAPFQYSRIKFPLKSPIILLKDDGETEQTFPFTRDDKWALLDSETLREADVLRRRREEFTYPALRRMDLPIKSSRPDMMSRSLLACRFRFDRQKWYVTDCYNDWYNSDLPVSELEETVRTMQEENKASEELHPWFKNCFCRMVTAVLYFAGRADIF